MMYANTQRIRVSPAPIPSALTVALMDQFAALELVADDLVDWSVGATLSEGLIEIELTIYAENAEAAHRRAHEITSTCIQMLDTGGGAPLTEATATELVAA